MAIHTKPGVELSMVTHQKVSAGSTVSERRSWPVRCYRLGTEPNDDLSTTTTPEERLEMMWPLAVEAWTLAGLPQPQYPRGEIPIRLVNRTTPRNEPGSN